MLKDSEPVDLSKPLCGFRVTDFHPLEPLMPPEVKFLQCFKLMLPSKITRHSQEMSDNVIIVVRRGILVVCAERSSAFTFLLHFSLISMSYPNESTVLPFIELNVDRKPCVFVIDSGASISSLSSHVDEGSITG